ncbi:MAG: hypothetical protein HQL24_06210 [Candidatus Omnitrophica bacterium]|nr:hypothetical protein [Candidatus Omnitrophota bacterium]
MENVLPKRQKNFFIKIVSTVLSFTFVFTTVIPPSYAQVMNLPQPGSMVGLTPAFMPTLIKGLKVHPENPLLFDFILDTGKSGIGVNTPEFKAESEKLIKYFLASMTIKESDLWVNLSPYEKNRIATEELGKTELGKDMLAQDYILKQLTASLMYPEKEIGKDFWNKVYAEAKQKFGTTDIPVDTFNKVWIVADKAKIFEHNDAAYVVGAHLKVMLEEDYVAASKSSSGHSTISPLSSPQSLSGDPAVDSRLRGNDRISSVIRQIILPAIEKEVNEGKNFATLRQMFYSMILATWYKQALKDALLNQVYSDKAKIGGVTTNDPAIKEKIYAQYLEAFKKGAYNYIKEEYDPATQQVTPKKYFSGGLEIGVGKVLARQAIQTPETDSAMAPNGDMAMVTTKVDKSSERAMTAKKDERSAWDIARDQMAAYGLDADSPENRKVVSILGDHFSGYMGFHPPLLNDYNGLTQLELFKDVKFFPKAISMDISDREGIQKERQRRYGNDAGLDPNIQILKDFLHRLLSVKLPEGIESFKNKTPEEIQAKIVDLQSQNRIPKESAQRGIVYLKSLLVPDREEIRALWIDVRYAFLGRFFHVANPQFGQKNAAPTSAFAEGEFNKFLLWELNSRNIKPHQVAPLLELLKNMLTYKKTPWVGSRDGDLKNGAEAYQIVDRAMVTENGKEEKPVINARGEEELTISDQTRLLEEENPETVTGSDVTELTVPDKAMTTKADRLTELTITYLGDRIFHKNSNEMGQVVDLAELLQAAEKALSKKGYGKFVTKPAFGSRYYQFWRGKDGSVDLMDITTNLQPTLTTFGRVALETNGDKAMVGNDKEKKPVLNARGEVELTPPGEDSRVYFDALKNGDGVVELTPPGEDSRVLLKQLDANVQGGDVEELTAPDKAMLTDYRTEEWRQKILNQVKGAVETMASLLPKNDWETQYSENTLNVMYRSTLLHQTMTLKVENQIPVLQFSSIGYGQKGSHSFRGIDMPLAMIVNKSQGTIRVLVNREIFGKVDEAFKNTKGKIVFEPFHYEKLENLKMADAVIDLQELSVTGKVKIDRAMATGILKNFLLALVIAGGGIFCKPQETYTTIDQVDSLMNPANKVAVATQKNGVLSYMAGVQKEIDRLNHLQQYNDARALEASLLSFKSQEQVRALVGDQAMTVDIMSPETATAIQGIVTDFMKGSGRNTPTDAAMLTEFQRVIHLIKGLTQKQLDEDLGSEMLSGYKYFIYQIQKMTPENEADVLKAIARQGWTEKEINAFGKKISEALQKDQKIRSKLGNIFGKADLANIGVLGLSIFSTIGFLTAFVSVTLLTHAVFVPYLASTVASAVIVGISGFNFWHNRNQRQYMVDKFLRTQSPLITASSKSDAEKQFTKRLESWVQDQNPFLNAQTVSKVADYLQERLHLEEGAAVANTYMIERSLGVDAGDDAMTADSAKIAKPDAKGIAVYNDLQKEGTGRFLIDATNTAQETVTVAEVTWANGRWDIEPYRKDFKVSSLGESQIVIQGPAGIEQYIAQDLDRAMTADSKVIETQQRVFSELRDTVKKIGILLANKQWKVQFPDKGKSTIQVVYDRSYISGSAMILKVENQNPVLTFVDDFDYRAKPRVEYAFNEKEMPLAVIVNEDKGTIRVLVSSETFSKVDEELKNKSKKISFEVFDAKELKTFGVANTSFDFQGLYGNDHKIEVDGAMTAEVTNILPKWLGWFVFNIRFMNALKKLTKNLEEQKVIATQVAQLAETLQEFEGLYYGGFLFNHTINSGYKPFSGVERYDIEKRILGVLKSGKTLSEVTKNIQYANQIAKSVQSQIKGILLSEGKGVNQIFVYVDLLSLIAQANKLALSGQSFEARIEDIKFGWTEAAGEEGYTNNIYTLAISILPTNALEKDRAMTARDENRLAWANELVDKINSGRESVGLLLTKIIGNPQYFPGGEFQGWAGYATGDLRVESYQDDPRPFSKVDFDEDNSTNKFHVRDSYGDYFSLGTRTRPRMIVLWFTKTRGYSVENAVSAGKGAAALMQKWFSKIGYSISTKVYRNGIKVELNDKKGLLWGRPFDGAILKSTLKVPLVLTEPGLKGALELKEGLLGKPSGLVRAVDIITNDHGASIQLRIQRSYWKAVTGAVEKQLRQTFPGYRIQVKEYDAHMNPPGSMYLLGTLTITNPRFLRKQMPADSDAAMSANMKNPGGIDLNAKNLQMNISKDGKGVEFKFDPKMVEQFKRGDFTGVVPVIIRITPISSPFPLLGLEIPEEKAIEISKKS